MVSDAPLGSQVTIPVRIWSCHHYPRADAPPALKRHTHTRGGDPGPSAPASGISARPSPARRFTKALCPAESRTPDSRKVPGEKSKAEAKSASLGHPGGQREKLKWWLSALSVSVLRLVPRTRRADCLRNRQGSGAFKGRAGVVPKPGAEARGGGGGGDSLTEPPPGRVADPRFPLSPARGGQGLAWPCLALCSPSSQEKPVRDWALSATTSRAPRQDTQCSPGSAGLVAGLYTLVHSFLPNNRVPRILRVHHRSGS